MVQVIGIGYGRTGTESLQEALNFLGYNSFHPQTMIWERPDLLEVFYTNITKKISRDDYCPLDLAEFLNGYTAATGSLFSVCLENALKNFPNAYFILTRQETSEDWFISWNRFLQTFSWLPQYAPRVPRVEELDFYHRWVLSYVHGKDRSFFKRPHPLQQNSDTARDSYETHIQTVRERIPSHRLLELEVGSGWDPLVGFLNVSVPPGVDYPHLGTYEQVVWQCRTVVAGANVLLMVVLFGSTKFLTRMFRPKEKREATTPVAKVESDDVNTTKEMKLDQERRT